MVGLIHKGLPSDIIVSISEVKYLKFLISVNPRSSAASFMVFFENTFRVVESLASKGLLSKSF